MVEDWISNAYEGMSRRQFLARTIAAGATITGFADRLESGGRRDHHDARPTALR